MTFLDRLSSGPLLCDGGYYLEFERRCLGSYKSHIPMAVLDHPEGVLQLHREFATAGAEVLQAMAWGVSAMDREAELHRVAVELAREVAGPDRFVAGTLSPRVYSGHPNRDLMTEDQATEASAFFERRVEQQFPQHTRCSALLAVSPADRGAVRRPLRVVAPISVNGGSAMRTLRADGPESIRMSIA